MHTKSDTIVYKSQTFPNHRLLVASIDVLECSIFLNLAIFLGSTVWCSNLYLHKSLGTGIVVKADHSHLLLEQLQLSIFHIYALR